MHLRLPVTVFALLVVPASFATSGCAELAGLQESGAGGPRATETTGARCDAARIEADVTLADFGEVRIDAPSPARTAVSLRNVGTAPVVVTPSVAGSPAFAVAPGDMVLGARETRVVEIAFSPLQLGPHAAKLRFATKGGTCDALPAVDLAGVGSDADVLVQPGALDFGVDCGGSTTPKPVTLASAASTALTFDAATAKGLFSIDRAGGVLAPGATTTLLVAPPAAAPLPGVAFDDVLTVLTPAPRLVRLHAESRGAVLTFEPQEVVFEEPGRRSVTVRNVGNRAVVVRIRASSLAYRVDANGITLGANEARTFEVELTTGGPGANLPGGNAFAASIVDVEGAPLCRRDPLSFRYDD